jgi:hypothetical protein
MRLVMRGEHQRDPTALRKRKPDRIRQDAAGSPLAEAEFQDRCLKPLGYLPW